MFQVGNVDDEVQKMDLKSCRGVALSARQLYVDASWHIFIIGNQLRDVRSYYRMVWQMR